jgi:hypothetical protein
MENKEVKENGKTYKQTSRKNKQTNKKVSKI